MPIFRLRGTASISHERIGSTLRMTTTTPDTNTIPRTACQVRPPARTNVQAKKTFCPMAGPTTIG